MTDKQTLETQEQIVRREPDYSYHETHTDMDELHESLSGFVSVMTKLTVILVIVGIAYLLIK